MDSFKLFGRFTEHLVLKTSVLEMGSCSKHLHLKRGSLALKPHLRQRLLLTPEDLSEHLVQKEAQELFDHVFEHSSLAGHTFCSTLTPCPHELPQLCCWNVGFNIPMCTRGSMALAMPRSWNRHNIALASLAIVSGAGLTTVLQNVWKV